MTAPPRFVSAQEYGSRIGDVGFWWPYLAEILERHDLADAGREPVAGFNATYPTFLYGDVVVKLFGYVRSWRERHAAERTAHALLATDPEIAAPSLLSEGRLYHDVDPQWPYLITTRMSGVALEDAELSAEQRRSIAAELGGQVRRVHALRPSGVATDADWPALDVAAAAEQSSLYRDTFGCDKALLRVFLEAYDWPIGKDFPRRALSLALYRQAMGLTQHLSMDVFEPVAALLPLHDIDTLDDLATELFAVWPAGVRLPPGARNSRIHLP